MDQHCKHSTSATLAGTHRQHCCHIVHFTTQTAVIYSVTSTWNCLYKHTYSYAHPAGSMLPLNKYLSRLKRQSSGAVWKSRWPSWVPVPNKPTVSVDIKQHSHQLKTNCGINIMLAEPSCMNKRKCQYMKGYHWPYKTFHHDVLAQC